MPEPAGRVARNEPNSAGRVARNEPNSAGRVARNERIETAHEGLDAPAGVAGRIVLIAGATGASGRATASALLAAGAHVVAVGSDRGRLDAFAHDLPDALPLLCDLTDAAAVGALVTHVHDTVGPIDGLIHLVGGWRGGGGLTAQSDDDWDFLERSLTALRLTSRAFYDDLVASPAGRLVMVSSTSVEHPTAGGANYAALKAAAEAWMRAVAQGFAKAGDTAAATIFVVRSLAGLEDDLAARIVALWQADAAPLNAARVPLSPPPEPAA